MLSAEKPRPRGRAPKNKKWNFASGEWEDTDEDLPEYDEGVPPSDIADAVVRMIAGDLSEEAVVAVGPSGAHGDSMYAEQSRTYGADGILFGNAPKL